MKAPDCVAKAQAAGVKISDLPDGGFTPFTSVSVDRDSIAAAVSRWLSADDANEYRRCVYRGDPPSGTSWTPIDRLESPRTLAHWVKNSEPFGSAKFVEKLPPSWDVEPDEWRMLKI